MNTRDFKYTVLRNYEENCEEYVDVHGEPDYGDPCDGEVELAEAEECRTDSIRNAIKKFALVRAWRQTRIRWLQGAFVSWLDYLNPVIIGLTLADPP